ncbi:MAG: PLP-dependent aminotransferase family protein [Clostridiales bacterium]|nr:PLP-dependent aminotransferase family protein [Clostridiales bacterium]MDO5140971.1 PLP-dependent aminotransferase family protein [Eubacteriales bacterium]
MKIQFAERSKDCKQPIIRVIDALSKSDPDFLAFGEGNPAIEALPQEAIRDIATDIVTNHAEDILLYTNNGGDQEFKDVIMKRLREVKGINTDGNDMLIITGGQQGLYLLPRIFTNEGDRVITEEITYAGMIDTIRDFRGETVGVRLEDDGPDVADLEEKLKTTERVSFIYLIPTFSNPTGITTSLEKRKAIYELACKYDKLIVEDDPYSDLRYEGEDVPTIKSMDTEHRVIYLGTFSKTIAAGLRVGFILAEPEIIRIATNNKAAIDSNTPCLNQLICRNFMRDYDFEENIRNIIRINKVKWKAARDSFNKYLPEGWKVYDAKGGLFCYVRSPEGVDEEAFQQCCYRHKVAFSPSSSFSADGLPHGGYRMAFTPNTVEQIIEGCRRFGEAAKEFT